MDSITESIKADPKLNEEYQKIVGMYKPQAQEIPTYESMKVKIIFKRYNSDN